MASSDDEDMLEEDRGTDGRCVCVCAFVELAKNFVYFF